MKMPAAEPFQPWVTVRNTAGSTIAIIRICRNDGVASGIDTTTV